MKSDKRVFTDKELEEMGKRTLDLLLEAIDSGDKERARNLAQRMYKEFNHLAMWCSVQIQLVAQVRFERKREFKRAGALF